jgi:hypothetical protein
MFNNFFFRKSWRLWDNVEKYGGAGRTTNDVTIWGIRVICWINKATCTHTNMYTYCFPTASDYVNVPQYYFLRALPVLFEFSGLLYVEIWMLISECKLHVYSPDLLIFWHVYCILCGSFSQQSSAFHSLAPVILCFPVLTYLRYFDFFCLKFHLEMRSHMQLTLLIIIMLQPGPMRYK